MCAATVACIGKGAGMICPDMATLLVFVLTDARLSAAYARSASREVGRVFLEYHGAIPTSIDSILDESIEVGICP